MSKSPTRFDWRAKLMLAKGSLAVAPTLPHIVRPVPRGDVVATFVLPLDLCPTTNRTRHSAPGQHANAKKHILGLMRIQARTLGARHPLEGRPQVLCCRFSSVEPDAYSDWAKMAVDLLCVPSGRRKKGLGYLRDDRPADAEVVQWWEPASPGDGFVYIEVRA